MQSNPLIDFTWGQKIPMPDGVRLNANIYRPRQSEPVPAIFCFTPYTADSNHAVAMFFAQHGYAFAAADMRGRGNSEGEYGPADVNWGQDGCEVAEWLAVQPWCNGSIAMWGGSALGGTQWLTLKYAPPHLKTIVPVASVGVGIDVPQFKNIFRSYEISWLTLTSGQTQNMNLFADSAVWRSIFHEMYVNHIPFNQLDRLAGNPSKIFQTWVSQPTPEYHLNN